MKTLAMKAHVRMMQLRADLKESGDRGSNAVEYALIIALIAIVVIAALIFLGSKLTGTFNTIGSAIP